MSNGKPFKMAKKYFLVDKDAYESAYGPDGGQTTMPRPERPARSEIINPFRDPGVRSVKEQRERIASALNDDSKSAEETNELLREMLNRYRDDFQKSSRGKRKGSGGGGGARQSSRTPAPTRTPLVSSLVTPSLPSSFRPTPLHQPPFHPVLTSDEMTTPKRRPAGGKLTKKTLRLATRKKEATSMSPAAKTWRRARVAASGEDELSPRSLSKALPGWTAPRDVEKLAPLLNAMKRGGLLSNDGRVKAVRTDGFTASKSEMQRLIKDVALMPSGSRSSTLVRIRQFERLVNGADDAEQ